MKTYSEIERGLTATSPMVQVRESLADLTRRFLTGDDGEGGSGITGAVKPYSQHPLVYACVKAIANNVAQVPFILTDPRTEETLPKDDPLSILFTNPNPMMSFYDLLIATETYLNLGGMCLWVPVPSLDGSNFVEFWPFSRKQFKAIIKDDQFFGWEVNWKGFQDKFLPEEVLYFRYFNPEHPINGMAPLEAARLAIDQDWWAGKYNEGFFRNGAELGVILSTDRSLTPDQIIQVRETFEARHAGFSNARRAMVIGGGFSVTELGMTKRDMQYIEQMRWSRDQIMTVFRVPPAELMIFEMVSTRVEGAGAQRRAFGEEVIAPELMMIQGKINNWLQFEGLDAVGTFDTAEVSILQDSRSELIVQAETLAKIGFPINAINEKLGLGFEKVPWGDEWFVQSGMLPASLLLEGTPEPPPEDESESKKFPRPPRRLLLTEADVRKIVEQYKPKQLTASIDTKEIPDVQAEEETEVHTESNEPQTETTKERYSDEELRLGRKIQGWLFDLRNDLLREADGLGKVSWVKAGDRLCKRMGVCVKGGRKYCDEILQPILEAVKGKSKQEIKEAFSVLKSNAATVARSVLQEKEKDDQPVTFEFEDVDRDLAWNEAMKFIGPIERGYARKLYKYFNDFEGQYLTAFRNQATILGPQVIRAVGEPDMDYAAMDTKLVNTSRSSVAEAVIGAGKCSRLTPSRSTRAKTTHVPMSREVRARAQTAQEDVAMIANGQSTPDNHPVDVLSGKNAIEVKAIVSSTNNKITMHPESLARKVQFVKAKRLRGMTVVVDLRSGEPIYYFRAGFGSFRITSMKQISRKDLMKLLGNE